LQQLNVKFVCSRQQHGTCITLSACFAPITQGSATNCIAAEHKIFVQNTQNLELIMQATTAVLFFAFLDPVKYGK